MSYKNICSSLEQVKADIYGIEYPNLSLHQVEVLLSLDLSELQDIANNLETDEVKLCKFISRDQGARAYFLDHYNEFYAVAEVA